MLHQINDWTSHVFLDLSYVNPAVHFFIHTPLQCCNCVQDKCLVYLTLPELSSEVLTLLFWVNEYFVLSSFAWRLLMKLAPDVSIYWKPNWSLNTGKCKHGLGQLIWLTGIPSAFFIICKYLKGKHEWCFKVRFTTPELLQNDLKHPDGWSDCFPLNQWLSDQVAHVIKLKRH